MAAGSIVIDLLLKTGAFETDTDRAGKQLVKLKKEAIAFGKDFGLAVTGFTAAVGIMVQQTVTMAAEIQRLSALSGTTANDFQRLAAGAKAFGIEQDKLSDIFKDTQDKVGDFIQTGGGALTDFFENIAPKVGVTADQFRELSGPDALQLYFSSLEKANLSQSDMIFYLEAIASDASLLIPLLKDGGAGFKDMGDQAERLGAVLSDDALAATEELRKSMVQLGQVKTAFTNRLTTLLVPALQNVVKWFEGTSNAGVNVGRAAEVAATGMKLLLSVGVLIGSVFKTLGEALGGLGAALVSLFEGRFRDAFNIGKNVAFDFVGNMRGAAAQVNSIWNASIPASVGMPTMRGGGGGLSPGRGSGGGSGGGGGRGRAAPIGPDFSAQDAEIDRITKEFERLEAERLRQIQQTQDEARRIYESTRTPLERLNAETAKLDELLSKGAISWDTYSRAILAAEEQYRPFIDETKAATNELAELGNELGLTFSSAFEDAIAGGKGLSEVLKGLEQDIIRIVTRKLVTEPLSNALSSAVSGAFGGGGGGDIFGTLARVAGSFFGGGFAGGGNVLGGRPILVGENGPEMFMPRTAGVVIPNDAMTTQPRTNMINVNVTAQPGMSRDTAIQQGARIAQGINGALQRNG